MQGRRFRTGPSGTIDSGICAEYRLLVQQFRSGGSSLTVVDLPLTLDGALEPVRPLARLWPVSCLGPGDGAP